MIAAEELKKSPALKQFIFAVPADFFSQFSPFEEHETALTPALLAFKSNLTSAIRVGTIPYTLTQSSAAKGRFRQLFTSEKILSLAGSSKGYPNSFANDEEHDACVAQRAHERMNEEITSDEGRLRHISEILTALERHMEDEDFLLSSNELLRQVLVMSWGAFETLANDSIRYLLNLRPSASGALLNSSHFRDVFGGKRNLLDLLLRHDFDLSTSMGDMFCDEARLDSLEKIRDVASCLFPDNEVLSVLGDAQLWKVSQQRHLIVHRRGVVDARYLSRTNDTTDIGKPLTFDADYIQLCLTLVRTAGLSFFGAAKTALFAERVAEERPRA